jgi:hypothetical protein
MNLQLDKLATSCANFMNHDMLKGICLSEQLFKFGKLLQNYGMFLLILTVYVQGLLTHFNLMMLQMLQWIIVNTLLIQHKMKTMTTMATMTLLSDQGSL